MRKMIILSRLAIVTLIFISFLSVDSVKLVKYKGMVTQFEKDKQNAANQAQQSADDNKKAADKLSNDPQNKKLARKADNTASTPAAGTPATVTPTTVPDTTMPPAKKDSAQ